MWEASWEWWQALDLNRKLAVLAVLIPVLSGIVSVCVNVAGYLITRRIERASIRDALNEEILRADRLQKKAELIEKLKDYPPWAVEMLRKDILELYGQEIRYEWDSMICVVTAVERHVRAEGIAERINDISLQFSGGKAETEPGQFDIEVSFNVNVTNSIAPDDTLDAVLLERRDTVLEPLAARAVLEANNKIGFKGVTIRPPAEGKVRQLVLRSVRLNVSQTGAPGLGIKDPPFQGKPPYEILAFVAVRPSGQRGSPVLMTNELVLLARPLLGTLTDVRSRDDERLGAVFERDAYRNVALLLEPSSVRPELTLNLCFEEGFEYAFTTIAEERAGTGDGNAVPVTGMRFLARFFNVPEGVSVFVTAREVEAGTTGYSRAKPKALWVSGSNTLGEGGMIRQPNEAPGEVARLRDGVPIYPVSISGGFGLAVWEWVSDDPKSPKLLEQVSFGIVLAADPAQPPNVGSAQVSGSLAPASTVLTASRSAPVPRFIDTNPDPQTFLSVLGDEFADDSEELGSVM